MEPPIHSYSDFSIRSGFVQCCNEKIRELLTDIPQIVSKFMAIIFKLLNHFLDGLGIEGHPILTGIPLLSQLVGNLKQGLSLARTRPDLYN